MSEQWECPECTGIGMHESGCCFVSPSQVKEDGVIGGGHATPVEVAKLPRGSDGQVRIVGGEDKWADQPKEEPSIIGWRCGCMRRTGPHTGDESQNVNCKKVRCDRLDPWKGERVIVEIKAHESVATLEQFDAAVREHLVPLLPARLKCVTDAVRCGFALWILERVEETERVVYTETLGQPLNEHGGWLVASAVANRLMERETLRKGESK